MGRTSTGVDARAARCELVYASYRTFRDRFVARNSGSSRFPKHCQRPVHTRQQLHQYVVKSIGILANAPSPLNHTARDRCRGIVSDTRTAVFTSVLDHLVSWPPVSVPWFNRDNAQYQEPTTRLLLRRGS